MAAVVSAARMLVVASSVLAGIACRAPRAGGPATTRLAERFKPEAAAAKPSPAPPKLQWTFGEGANGWTALGGVAGLSARDGRLAGRATNEPPILHALRPAPDSDHDLLSSIEVRSFSLSSEPPGRLGFWGSPVVRNNGARRGVIVIWADTLRPDHLDVYGYARPTSPSLRRMAEQGTLFRNCLTQATWTKVSTPILDVALPDLPRRARMDGSDPGLDGDDGRGLPRRRVRHLFLPRERVHRADHEPAQGIRGAPRGRLLSQALARARLYPVAGLRQGMSTSPSLAVRRWPPGSEGRQRIRAGGSGTGHGPGNGLTTRPGHGHGVARA
jgi:hypothetical protein